MKTKFYLSLVCIFALIASAQAQFGSVKGNGKASTHTVNISAYDNVQISGAFDFEYEQSDGAPFLSVTIDDNLFEYIEVTVINGALKIGTKRNGLSNVNIRPTVFRIKSNSKELKNVSLSGSGKFISTKQVSAKSLSLTLSGSGNVTFNNLNASSTSCIISGSGNMHLSGKSQSAEYKVSGSGGIKAYDYKAEKASAFISGSGNIEVYASSELEAICSGSGNIRYKGSPEVKSKKSGSGSISAQ